MQEDLGVLKTYFMKYGSVSGIATCYVSWIAHRSIVLLIDRTNESKVDYGILSVITNLYSCNLRLCDKDISGPSNLPRSETQLLRQRGHS